MKLSYSSKTNAQKIIQRFDLALLFESVSDSQESSPSLAGYSHGFAAQTCRASPRKHLICCVENARSAFSTQQIKTSERRRREQALKMAIRQTLTIHVEERSKR